MHVTHPAQGGGYVVLPPMLAEATVGLLLFYHCSSNTPAAHLRFVGFAADNTPKKHSPMDLQTHTHLWGGGH